MKKTVITVSILAVAVLLLLVSLFGFGGLSENDTFVRLSKSSISFYNVGEVAEVSATLIKDGIEVDISDGEEEVVWTSSDTAVATVENGVVTAVGYGSCVIRVHCAGASAFCTVSNPNPNPMFVISETELVLDNIGKVSTLYLTTDAGENISSMARWRSSNEAVASCQDGIVTANGYGSCTITATYNRKATTCIITVNNPTAPNVTLTMKSMKLAVGESSTLEAILANNAGSEVMWKSTNPDVATCEDGVVTAKKDGTCAVMAITDRGYSDVCIVTSGKGDKPFAHANYLEFGFPHIGKTLQCVDKSLGQVSSTAVVVGYKMETLLLSDGRLVVEIKLICVKTYDIDGLEGENPTRITATLYRENDTFCDKRVYKARNVAVGDVFEIECSGFTVQTKTDGTARQFYMNFATVTEN